VYDDAANHRYIVEWSRCAHMHGFRPPYVGELQTFEAMLYDQQYYPTRTGDGPILVQQLLVVNDDTLFENNHNFATVGIQSPDRDDGLEYTFANLYPPAAAVVGPNRAIRFTTNPPDTFIGVKERGIAAVSGRLAVLPSPARGALRLLVSCGREPARLDVYDVLGRPVRSFSLVAGTSAVSWDRLDNAGRYVPAGVYRAVLTPSSGAGRMILSVKVVLVD
jgi:hypothetical protein